MEVNRDYHRGEQPRQEVGGNSQDDSTLGVITTEEVDRGSQKREELEEEDLALSWMSSSLYSSSARRLAAVSPLIWCMEDANSDYDSHSNTQDDSIDSLLNDTNNIIDDPTVDNSQEETVEKEICLVCHDTFENIEKEGILRVKLVCRQKSKN